RRNEQITNGPAIVPTLFKMPGKHPRQIACLRWIQALQALGDPTVQLRAKYRGCATVQKLPVQRVQEFKLRGNDTVWKFIHANEADEPLSIRERFARVLDHVRV